MDRYEVSRHIQSECGKTRTRETANTDTFRTVSTLLKTVVAITRIFNLKCESSKIQSVEHCFIAKTLILLFNELLFICLEL